MPGATESSVLPAKESRVTAYHDSVAAEHGGLDSWHSVDNRRTPAFEPDLVSIVGELGPHRIRKAPIRA